jgi:hypothetical protein
MEHRWGHRVGVDLPVRIIGTPFPVRASRLANLSTSGAFILTDADLRLLSRVLVVIETPSTVRGDAPTVPGYVARKLREGIGIEWCEFAPLQVTRILQSVSSRRRTRFYDSESSPHIAIARLSTSV